jgi:hypothetical protein
LPETTLRVASRRPTTQPSAVPLTCAVVWQREVVHGGVDYPRINGMQALTPDSGGYWALLDWALVHIPREEWTPVHVQVLCWRIVTWCVGGVVLDWSFLSGWPAIPRPCRP